MAIYRAGALASGISGSVAGVTFVNARGSKVIRHRPPKLHKTQRTKPLTNQTPRNALQGAIQGWQALAEIDRAAWRSLASQVTFPNRLGQNRQLTGYLLYLKVNIHALMSNLALSTGPPSTTRPPKIPNIVLQADAVTGLIVDFSTPLGFLVDRGLTYGAIRYDGNAKAFFRDFVYLGVFAYSTILPTDLTTAWEARYGPLRAGQAVAIRILPWREDTYPTTPGRASTVVTP